MSQPDNLAVQLFMSVVSATRVLLSMAVGIYIAVQFLNLSPALHKMTDKDLSGSAAAAVGPMGRTGAGLLAAQALPEHRLRA